MSDAPFKSKIISFRLSDQEYQIVEDASQVHGFRSVPLFVRARTLTCNSSEPVHSPLDTEIDQLGSRIAALSTLIEKLIAHLGAAMSPFNLG